MRKEVCKECSMAVPTSLNASLLYCGTLCYADKEWKERLSHRMATPALCQYIAQKFDCMPGRKPPMSCPYRCEQAVLEGDLWQ